MAANLPNEQGRNTRTDYGFVSRDKSRGSEGNGKGNGNIPIISNKYSAKIESKKYFNKLLTILFDEWDMIKVPCKQKMIAESVH